ncbi:MAG: Asp-tRNA(Asn)/Glu-tRNA(Gln) amidotransferase subunit GatC [Treponemataceae bacterium]|nr:MAG: Asp-tRNA(Asn)/Glu-tRNA(Gln) amidotransferase subunit GatC [Treponemataceae bacterium]
MSPRLAAKSQKWYAFIMSEKTSEKTQKAITDETLEALLYLSRLSGDSMDLPQLKKQFGEVISYFDILSRFTSGVYQNENPYDAYPSVNIEDLRQDESVAGLEISDLKQVTPEFLDGYFRVPKVLGEGV